METANYRVVLLACWVESKGKSKVEGAQQKSGDRLSCTYYHPPNIPDISLYSPNTLIRLLQYRFSSIPPTSKRWVPRRNQYRTKKLVNLPSLSQRPRSAARAAPSFLHRPACSFIAFIEAATKQPNERPVRLSSSSVPLSADSIISPF